MTMKIKCAYCTHRSQTLDKSREHIAEEHPELLERFDRIAGYRREGQT